VIAKRVVVGWVGLSVLALSATACSGSASRGDCPQSAVCPASAHLPAITHFQYGASSASIGVPGPDYAVEVATSGPCFVQETAGSIYRLFSGMMLPGQTETFVSLNGRLSVQLGSVQAKVTVEYSRDHGRTAQVWPYTPPTAPLTLNFASVA
jgi:hypothetical protein